MCNAISSTAKIAPARNRYKHDPKGLLFIQHHRAPRKTTKPQAFRFPFCGSPSFVVGEVQLDPAVYVQQTGVSGRTFRKSWTLFVSSLGSGGFVSYMEGWVVADGRLTA